MATTPPVLHEGEDGAEIDGPLRDAGEADAVEAAPLVAGALAAPRAERIPALAVSLGLALPPFERPGADQHAAVGSEAARQSFADGAPVFVGDLGALARFAVGGPTFDTALDDGLFVARQIGRRGRRDGAGVLQLEREAAFGDAFLLGPLAGPTNVPVLVLVFVLDFVFVLVFVRSRGRGPVRGRGRVLVHGFPRRALRNCRRRQ